MKTNQYVFLVLNLYLVGFLSPQAQVAWAEGVGDISAEPSNVPVIRQEVHVIDKQVSKWKSVNTEETCEGEGCSSSTFYLDPQGKVRKIELEMNGSGPANSRDHFETTLTYYYDHQEQAIFCFSDNHSHFESATPHDQQFKNRYYFRNGQLVAWKRNDTWMSATDALWSQTSQQTQTDVQAALGRAKESAKQPRFSSDVNTEWSRAALHIVSVAPSDVRDLPPNVSQELEKRGCRLPTPSGHVDYGDDRQTEFGHGEYKPWASGHFGESSDIDYAAVCLKKNNTTIEMVWGGKSSCPSQAGASLKVLDRLYGGESQKGKFYYFYRFIKTGHKEGHDLLIEADDKGVTELTCTAGHWDSRVLQGN